MSDPKEASTKQLPKWKTPPHLLHYPEIAFANAGIAYNCKGSKNIQPFLRAITKEDGSTTHQIVFDAAANPTDAIDVVCSRCGKIVAHSVLGKHPKSCIFADNIDSKPGVK